VKDTCKVKKKGKPGILYLTKLSLKNKGEAGMMVYAWSWHLAHWEGGEA
jgi:hypothetical protein